MSVSSFFSSFFPVVHGDAPDKQTETEEEQPNTQEEEAEIESEETGKQEAEEEEEEPEDVFPHIREECQNTTKCAPLAKHFHHCQEKVEAGKGYKHEDCVEELFHMMHCVDNCAAPKLFSKLH